MAKLSFDDIRQKASAEFDDLQIDEVVFRHPLRIGKEGRKALFDLIKRIEDTEDNEEVLDISREILVVAAQAKTAARKLLDRLDDVELQVVANEYMKAAQPGEADS